MELITSLQNSKVKNLVLLQEKARERKKQELFVIEGYREIDLALNSGYILHSLFIYTDINKHEGLINKFNNTIPIYNISKNVYNKIAYRENSDGLVAVAASKNHMLTSINLNEKPFIIVLESVEKPGNLGAILRTADAANVDAVIVCDPQCDIYNPNVVRSSIGCIFSTQIGVCSSDQALEWLANNNITTYAAELKASKWYHETNMAIPCAVIMGTEATGLTDFWLKNASSRIKIPMRGKIDSLNVSVSTAVITFEAMRQRGFSS